MPNGNATLGRFTIEREIGKGGMSRVYLAGCSDCATPLALKLLLPRYLEDEETIAFFKREAEIGSEIKHPNIVQVYESGEIHGTPYILMEYVDGVSLRKILEGSGRLTVAYALLVIDKITQAFQATWEEKRLVHNDIKPDNILLTPDGNVKLADLALAESKSFSKIANSEFVFGTPQYVSPERIQGQEVDFRSDVYSLGATLYHLLAGHYPFPGLSADEQAKRHLIDTLIPLNWALPDIPLSVSRLIDLMMAKSIEFRHHSLSDLLKDIHEVRCGGFPVFPLAPDAQDPLITPEEAGFEPFEIVQKQLSPELKNQLKSDLNNKGQASENMTEKGVQSSKPGALMKKDKGLGFVQSVKRFFKKTRKAHNTSLARHQKGDTARLKQDSLSAGNEPSLRNEHKKQFENNDRDGDTQLDADSGESNIENTLWWVAGESVFEPQHVFEEICSYELFEVLEQKLNDGEILIALPQNVQKAIQILNQTEFDYADLLPVVERSPGLAGHVLRLANSSVYRRGVVVNDLKVALPRIPPSVLKAALYIAATRNKLDLPPFLTDVVNGVIRHSVAVSVIAGYLAKYLNTDVNTPMIAGLLHDVGKLALLKELDAQFNWPDDIEGQLSELSFENILPTMHERAGEFVAQHWGLVPEVATAVSEHHMMDFSFRTGGDEASLHLTALISVADVMARLLGYGRPLLGVNLFNLVACRTLGIEPDAETIAFFREIPARLEGDMANYMN